MNSPTLVGRAVRLVRTGRGFEFHSRLKMNGYVYVLQSLKNNRFYIGSTTNIQRRLIEHNSGRSTYTSFSRPFELIFSQKFDSITIAKKIEFKIKQFKSKKVIIDIIKSGEIRIDEFFNISW